MHHYSPSAERNKAPILDQLSKWLGGDETILEIGSASGQHALFFANNLPNIRWQCGDRTPYLAQLADNIQTAKQTNVLPPIELDVMHYHWALHQYDAVFTANTLHIMTQVEVDYFLTHVHQALRPEGKLIVYGPFNYQDTDTSESNREFDSMLRQRNVGSCIKSFEAINGKLVENQFTLINDIAMPANNRLMKYQFTLLMGSD